MHLIKYLKWTYKGHNLAILHNSNKQKEYKNLLIGTNHEEYRYKFIGTNLLSKIMRSTKIF